MKLNHSCKQLHNSGITVISKLISRLDAENFYQYAAKHSFLFAVILSVLNNFTTNTRNVCNNKFHMPKLTCPLVKFLFVYFYVCQS